MLEAGADAMGVQPHRALRIWRVALGVAALAALIVLGRQAGGYVLGFAGWGPFFDRCPQKKFWLGLIPFYGWPGYLQVLSAIDAYHGRTSDNLRPLGDEAPPRRDR